MITARETPGVDRMDEWKQALEVIKLRTFLVGFHTLVNVQVV